MKNKLSIIIPCYNCEKTLEESVNSCYTQGFTENEFEIIMVDDSSTDQTFELITKLVKKHSNIIGMHHPTNRGGGAARNTGIKKSNGDFIYCLDSDNFFGHNRPLRRMVEYIKDSGLDGASFHERRFFVGNDFKHYDSYFNEATDRDIKLKDLFSDEAVLLDNFLYTKKSYLKTKGYPEYHGFDTQCFEVRYLAAGNRVRACRDTTFYHKQAMGSHSYFEREYDKGNFSKNYFLIMEDIFESLSPIAKDTMLNFDIFSRSSMDDNLMIEMKKLQSKGQLFKKLDGESTSNSSILPKYIEHYESSLKSYKIASYAKALKELRLAMDAGFESRIAYYHEQRCLSGQGGISPNEIDKTVSEMEMFSTKKQKLYKAYHRIPVVNRFISNIIKWKKAK
jgi:glycosyltransferase involved in cell wall biosynthesis